MKKRTVGLLGGSFNPAHEGHAYISHTALQTLGLDEIWWLVAPQNPLKDASELGDFDKRLSDARRIAASRRIKVSDFERNQELSYTAKSLKKLIRAYPNYSFVWLMGADNLAQIPKWYKWRDIFNTCPVAVFDRPGDTYKALSGEAAHFYRSRRQFPSGWGRPIANFAKTSLPAWTFIPYTKHKMSSTYIRKSEKESGKACS